MWWYRSLWLSGIGANETDRPPLPQSHTIRIVQDNEAASRVVESNGTLVNVIQVYSSCPTVELLVNGVSKGKQQVARYMWAEYDFPFTAGNLTAVGYDSSGAVAATHSVETASPPSALRIAVDVPSVSTGTGSSLVLDGQDTGLLRVEVVDHAGRVVPFATNNVTFKVLSGPGSIIGVGNGDPTNHEPNTAAWRSAFHGLVRGIVRVTMDAASAPAHRDLLIEVDGAGGRGGITVVPSNGTAPTDPIVVEASAPGLTSSTVEIQVSTDVYADGVLAVASRSTKVAFGN